jgi:catechol 2,3-dioxygenase-like lactoylglutathione lyase family enzyme
VAVDSLVGRIAGVSYLHIPARDAAASAAFYRDVFGWKLHGQPDKPSFSDGTGHVIGRWVTDQAPAGNVLGIWQETSGSQEQH